MGMVRKVRLELARCHEFPEGSTERGYELTVALTPDGHLDRNDQHDQRRCFQFRRFWGDEEEQGRIAHHSNTWTLIFNGAQGKSEPIFKGDEHRFKEGEYVSIKERDGVTRTFRVASVR